MSENWKKQKEKTNHIPTNFFPNAQSMAFAIDENLEDLRKTIEKKRKLKAKYLETIELLKVEIHRLNIEAQYEDKDAETYIKNAKESYLPTITRIHAELAIQEKEHALRLRTLAKQLDDKRIQLEQEVYML